MALSAYARRGLGRWLGLMAVLAVALLWKLPSARLATDILALLPVPEESRAAATARTAFNTRAERQVSFLVGAPGGGSDAARAAAADLLARLARAPGLATDVHGPVATAMATTMAAASPGPDAPPAWGRRALSDAVRARLAARPAADALAAQALDELAGPLGLARPLPVLADPLNLAGQSLLDSLPAPGNLQLDNGWLVARAAGRSWVFLTFRLGASAYDAATQDRLLATVGAFEAAHPEIRLVRSGVVFHARANADSAQREMALIGGIALAGTLGLTGLFLGVRGLVLSFVPLLTGFAAGVAACWWLFGELHVLALVFGGSLIGIAADHTFHWYAARFAQRHPGGDTRPEALAHTAGTILFGCATTALAYLALVVAPLPGLKQIGILGAAGLMGACVTVLWLFPALAPDPRAGRAWHALATQARRWLGPWPLPVRAGFWVLMLALLAGALRLHTDDDLRRLGNSPPTLIAQERQFRELTGTDPRPRFFLVEGASAAETLARAEALRARLSGRADVRDVQDPSEAWPSRARQAENLALTAPLCAPGGGYDAVLAALGLAPAAAAAPKARLCDPGPELVPSATARPGEPPWADAARWLWLGETSPGHVFAVVRFDSRADSAVLAPLAAGLPGVSYADRLAEAAQLLEHARRSTAWLLVLAIGLMTALLVWRYGWRVGGRIATVPALAVAGTLGWLGWLGQPLDVFAQLALLLVVGAGEDFALFLHEAGARAPGDPAAGDTAAAVVLCACTTWLSFGLLVASHTPFIHGMGLVMAPGLVLALLLARAIMTPPAPPGVASRFAA